MPKERRLNSIPDCGYEIKLPILLSLTLKRLYRVRTEIPRILMAHYDTETGEIYKQLIDRAQPGPNDIIYVPLFGSRFWPDGNRLYAESHVQRIRFFNDNMEFIKAIAPNIKGILIGNCGPELTYSGVWVYDREKPRSIVSDKLAEFVRHTAPIVTAAGAKPYYAPLFWDVAIDCHYGNAALRDAINEVGGGMMVLTGAHLIGANRRNKHWPHPETYMISPYDDCPVDDPDDLEPMANYILGTHEIMCGAEYFDGLQRGTSEKIEQYGFDAIILGLSSSFPADWAQDYWTEETLIPEIFTDTLLELIKRPSPSGREDDVAEYASEYLKKDGFSVEIDDVGNLIACRGEPPYVLLSAHMDTAQTHNDVDAILQDIEDGSISSTPHSGLQQGYDDKVGIAIILTLVDTTELPMKVVLTTMEETGQIGAKHLGDSFYSDVLFAIILDRKGDKDMVTRVHGEPTASQAFVTSVDKFIKKIDGHEYEPCEGKKSDVVPISKHVDAINLSVGFFDEHTFLDGYSIDDALMALKLTRHIVVNRKFISKEAGL